MFTGWWLLIVNPYMSVETALFPFFGSIVSASRDNEIVAFWFRYLVISLWRDLNEDDDFPAVDLLDRISTDTSVVLNMFSKGLTLFFVKIIYENVL